jgi:hypothetical protein
MSSSEQVTFKFRIERQIPASKVWYDVMLSPFNSVDECDKYINTYKHYYPQEDRVYRITKYEI